MVDGDDLVVLRSDLEKYGVREDVFEDRKLRAATVARAYLAAHRWCTIEQRVRDVMPIRFIPRSSGLFTKVELPPPSKNPLKDEFYFYFGVGNNQLTLPVLHEAKARNFLISYFYIDKREKEHLIKSYIDDPEATLKSPLYIRYYRMLHENVLIDGKRLEYA
jgi:hypothetical protein